MQKIKKEKELTPEEKSIFEALVIELEKKKVSKLKVLEYIFIYLDDIRGKRTGIAITYTDDRGVSKFQSELYDLKILSRKLKLKKLRF